MLAPQRNDGDPAEGEPLPAGDGVGGPVPTVVALRGHGFVAFEAGGEVWKMVLVDR